MAVTSKAELAVKALLDQIYPNEPYADNCRPLWLEGLELDRFYLKLGLAIEINGPQHYRRIRKYQHSPLDFKRQIYYDSKKRRLCAKAKICFLAIDLRQKPSLDGLRTIIAQRLAKAPNLIAAEVAMSRRMHGKNGPVRILRRAYDSPVVGVRSGTAEKRGR